MSQMQVRQRRNIRYQSVYDDVVEVKSYLERMNQEERSVTRHFEAWHDHRKVTIETIDDLQKKMDFVCVSSNVVQCVGAAAGIVGLISGIAGMFLEANKDESADDFKQFGKYCAGAGAAAVVSSNAIEAVINQSTINKIKIVLKKDLELTEPLKNWIQISNEVKDRVERLFQCNIVSETFTNVIEVCRQCVRLLINGEAEFQDLLFRLQNYKMEGFKDISLEVMQKAYYFLRDIQNSPGLLQPLGQIFKIFQETPHTFEFVKLGVTIYNNTCDILKLEPLTMMLYDTIGSSLLRRCALDTIAIGSHVVTIVLSIKNIKEAKSKYSDQLDHIKFALRKELREITNKMNVRAQNLYLNYENMHQICY